MAASGEELRSMQETLLRAVLLGEPLRGTSINLAMPDLQFVTKGESILLLGENLHGSLSVPDSPKPLRIVDRADLHSGSETTNQAYLRFAPSTVEDNAVSMKLEARMLSQQSGPEMGLSSVQIQFHRVGDQWIANAPMFSAA